MAGRSVAVIPPDRRRLNPRQDSWSRVREGSCIGCPVLLILLLRPSHVMLMTLDIVRDLGEAGHCRCPGLIRECLGGAVSALGDSGGSGPLSVTAAVITIMSSHHGGHRYEPRPKEPGGVPSRGIQGRWVAFWTVAGGMAAVIGLLLTFFGPSSGSGPSSGPHSTASGSTPGVAPTTPTVRWQGPIAINGSGVDLDALPPTTGGQNYTLYEDAGGGLDISSGTFAEWTGSSPPTYRPCHNLVVAQGGSRSFQLTSGLEVCVLTQGGRTAYVKVTGQSANGWGAQVIVWNLFGPSSGSGSNSPSPGPQSTASGSAPGVASTTPTVRWQGPIAINGSGVDLDALPPTIGGQNYTLYEDAGGGLDISSGTFAEWTGSSPPTYSPCHNLVVTQGGSRSFQLTSGLEVCVLTQGGRTAYVKVTGQSANGWGAQVIVWNQ